MVNLIPARAKKNVTTEYWFRVFSAWCYLWAAALMVAVFATLPAYVLINLQVKAYDDVASVAEEKVTDYKEVSKELIKSSRQAVLVVNNNDKKPLHEYLDLFERMQNNGVMINQISLGRSETGVEPVTLSGSAESRAALATFRDQLLSDENVAEVDLPISNLAKDKDIQFSMTIVMTNQAGS